MNIEVRFDDPHLQPVDPGQVGPVGQDLTDSGFAAGAAADQEVRPGRGDRGEQVRRGWVVVRRTTRVSSLARSMVIVSSATWTVTMRRAWMRPRAVFCPAIMITPVLLATRRAVTGSAEGRGGGPAGRGRQHWRILT